jgi:multicomponent Na+:H+ antiporter subunit G
MTVVYWSVSAILLATVAVGLWRFFKGPTAADRLMVTQLFGTTGVAVCLLLSAALQNAAIVDVASRPRPAGRRHHGGFHPLLSGPHQAARRTGEKLMIDWISALLLLFAAFFFVGGTVGLLRFPDVYCRLHALTKADNIGLGFVVLALLIQAESWDWALKLLIVWIFVMAASATNAYLDRPGCHSKGHSAMEAAGTGIIDLLLGL